MSYKILHSHSFWIGIALVSVLLLFSLTVDGFCSLSNLLSSARNFSFFAIAALGVSIVIISGGIDLSVGSVMGLAGVITASVMHQGGTIVEGVSAGILAAGLCGLVNGALISGLKISPFVVTLGMLSIARSLAVVISGNQTLFDLGPQQREFFTFGGARITPLIVLVIIALILQIALLYTKWGRHIFALGGNADAAVKAGVSARLITLSVYVLSSCLAAVAGILMVAWLGSVSSALGTGAELSIIASAVIGGVQLTGGYGALAGVVIGAALLEVIRNGLTLSGVNPYWQGALVGSCIILAVVIDSLRRLSTFHTGSLRRILVAAAIIGALVVGASAYLHLRSPSDGLKKKLVFALVPKFMNHPFFEEAGKGCKQAALENQDFECLFIGPSEPSEQMQIQILQDLITRKVDGIAIAPANSSAVGKALILAREANIPVVTFDSDLLPLDKGLRKVYVGTENRKLGEALGVLLKKLRPQPGTVALLSGGAAAENLNQRMDGLKSKFPGWMTEVDGTPLYCNDDSSLAIQQMEEILGKYPNLSAFVSLGAWPLSVQQAYRTVALRYRDRIDNKQLIVLSADTLPMQLEIVKDKLAHGLVGQRPFEMGYRSALALKAIIAGENVTDPIFTDLEVVEISTNN